MLSFNMTFSLQAHKTLAVKENISHLRRTNSRGDRSLSIADTPKPKKPSSRRTEDPRTRGGKTPRTLLQQKKRRLVAAHGGSSSRDHVKRTPRKHPKTPQKTPVKVQMGGKGKNQLKPIAF